MTVQDASGTPSTSPEASDVDDRCQALVDEELTELRQLLDRIDGLTHDARRRLRYIERHRQGVAPEWTYRRD